MGHPDRHPDHLSLHWSVDGWDLAMARDWPLSTPTTGLLFLDSICNPEKDEVGALCTDMESFPRNVKWKKQVIKEQHL